MISIKMPVWDGGERCVGIAEWKVQGNGYCDVEIVYKNKDGERLYPNAWRIPCSVIRQYELKPLKNKPYVCLYMVKIKDLKDYVL